MESIGAFEAKTHLSELIERVALGEEIRITKHGRRMARLVPDTAGVRDPSRVERAAERLKRFHKRSPHVTLQELLTSAHEGHRY